MKTKAAVVWGPMQGNYDVTEVELDPPKEHEVLVHWKATGLCHSDHHSLDGSLVVPLPMVAGHEGAGIVTQLGPGVTRFKVGDHVVGTALPSCGHCRWCATGQSNLCEMVDWAWSGRLFDNTCRFHGRGQDITACAVLGTFSQYAVVPEYSLIKIDDDIPFEAACLASCGVLTGWGAAVVAAKVEPGDTVVIYGAGGIGMNAVQGAKLAGAVNIVVVDNVPFKCQMAMELGATHAVGSFEEAHELVADLTGGVLADKSILAISVISEESVQSAFDIVRKGGTVAIASAGEPKGQKAIHLSGDVLTSRMKTIVGIHSGNLNVKYDVVRLLRLYKVGLLKLDEMITARYKLEDINNGYKDLFAGKIIRGVVIHA